MVVSVLISAGSAMVVSGALGFILIPWLKKLHFGQTIKDIGPSWHKSKQGTPLMGGFMFIIGSCVGLAAGLLSLSRELPGLSAALPDYGEQQVRLFAGLASALLFSAVGFADDYLKAIRKNNAGLRGWYKILFQVLIAAGYLFVLTRWGGLTTKLDFPFIGTADLGIFYYLFAFITIIGFVNAVNLTDGIDGLAASVTFVYMLAILVSSALLGCFGITVWTAAIAGGCAGFLIWNFHPAKVFMGDTGSMFLGGCAVAVAFAVDQPLFIFLCGIVYLCEAFSVIIQVCYYKATHGKRLFKMTPIHHHFELSGYSEVKIVALFSFVTLLGCAAAVASLFVR